MHLYRTSVLLPPVIVGALFATTLVGLDRLAFRDVSHFYTPLYDYVAFRCESDWMPLWNPLDQTGCPLVGETTTAVLYPIRLLCFSLPIQSETAMAWYVALHLILASYAARVCARCCGTTKRSAIIASIIYPLSGGVLFLFTNPPYLVGAAWLPLVLGPMLSRLRIPAGRRIVVAGFSLAMMVLGGDPQTALHAMLIATMIGVSRFALRRSGGCHRWLPTLIAVPVLAALLAAPQIAASISWGSQSERVADDKEGHWLDPPVAGSKRQHAFQFSLPPWHLAEIITPNAFGLPLPVNRRISERIPGDGRMWTPTIYLGMLAAIVLLSRICQLRRRPLDAWTAIAVVSLLLSLGHFGGVWLLQNLSGLLAGRDSAIGGPYWCLYNFLPGYDAFRYPAKWLPIFSLACAMVTAAELDRRLDRDPARVQRITIGLLVVVIAAWAAVFVLRRNPDSLFPTPPVNLSGDPFWGPLDISGGLAQVQRSLVHSAIVLVAILLILRSVTKRLCDRRVGSLCLTGVVALDLCLSGAALISRVSKEREQALIAATTEHQPEGTESGRWMRTQAGGGWPRAWRESTDRHRLIDVEASGRLVWFGRWHLADRQAVFNNMTSIRSRPMAMFWRATAGVTDGMTTDSRDRFWQSMRNWLGIGGVTHATAKSTDVAVDGRVATMVDFSHLYRPTPQIQFYESWESVMSDEASVSQWEEMLMEISQAPETRRPRVSGAAESVTSPNRGLTDGAAATLRVVTSGPERELIEVTTETQGLLTRTTLQDGNWVAEVTPADRSDWNPIAVHRVDYLKQGVIVPAGHWRVRFRYAPAWQAPAIAVALIAWACLLLTAPIWCHPPISIGATHLLMTRDTRGDEPT